MSHEKVVVQTSDTVTVKEARQPTVIRSDSPTKVPLSKIETQKVTNQPAAQKVGVGQTGPRGPAGPENLHVGPNQPTFDHPGIWVETGLGDSGDDMTMWVEDGT